MRRGYFWLIIGTTGSGKTTTATEILRPYVRKPQYIAIVNSTEQLAEFARVRVVVSSTDLEREWTTAGIKALLRKHRAVHFEVSPGGEPKRIRAWMDALCGACMELGRVGTKRCEVLLVIDEASNYLGRDTFARNTRRVYAEGRKYGVDVLAIIQQLTGTGGDTLHMTVRRMTNILVVHPMDEPNECARVVQTWPELRNPAELKMPDPARKTPGEYQIRDRQTRRAALLRVDASGRRREMPLTLGGPSPPGR